MLVELPSGQWIEADDVIAVSLNDEGTLREGPPQTWKVVVMLRGGVRATEYFGQMTPDDARTRYRAVVQIIQNGRGEPPEAVLVKNPDPPPKVIDTESLAACIFSECEAALLPSRVFAGNALRIKMIDKIQDMIRKELP